MDSLTSPAMVGLLRRDIPTPLYRQLHQFLRGQILQGDICHNAATLAREARVAVFARCGISIARVEQSVSAANADAVPALKLEMTPGDAVLTLERRSYGSNNQLLDLLNVQYRPDQLRYQIRLDYESTTGESHS